MNLRSILATTSFFLLPAMVACVTTSSSGTGGAGGAGAPPTQARSSLPRDPVSQLPSAVAAAAVSANNAFAVDLFSRVRSGMGSSNLLTSPLSASLALTMAYAGAQGQTATEMATALHLGAAAPSIFAGQNALSQTLGARASAALAAEQQTASTYGQPAPSPDDYQLQIVNSVWGEKTYPWEAPFLDVLAKSYGTGVNLVDFKSQFEAARQSINTWVSAETSDRINNLLPPRSLDGDTRMVLVNAIHLKLHWAAAFPDYATAPAPFTKSGGATVSAPFMNETSTFAYADDGDAQVVSLPLADGKLAVLIALPHGDLATYEAGLAAGSAALSQPTSYDLVALSLPKVAFTSPTFSLKQSLKAMGMVQAFDAANADLKGLCADPPDHLNLSVDDVLQKTMVAMKETGVEAAAATAVIVGQASASSGGPPPMPVPMVVNRPFLMSIIDVPTGAILFLGHIEDPTDPGGP